MSVLQISGFNAESWEDFSPAAGRTIYGVARHHTALFLERAQAIFRDVTHEIVAGSGAIG
jgi:hypothetical protein